MTPATALLLLLLLPCRAAKPPLHESRWMSASVPATGRLKRAAPLSNKRPAADASISKDRELYSAEDYDSYLVNRFGQYYEPYSLSWRYLGSYIDCDIEPVTYYGSQSQGDQGDWSNRRLSSGSGDSEEEEDSCSRKVLWAAYVDKKYQGGEIGEYAFYQVDEDEWDGSTCKTNRCAHLDCHEPNSHFSLIGVFKETDGFEDWAEQLFKHLGICAWNDDDTYSFMQTYRQTFVTSCVQLSLPDSYGNTLYVDIKPLEEGNITYGIYTDEVCSEESPYVNFADYVVMYYSQYYGYDGSSEAQRWNATFELWNEYMTTFKICQPCRAYDLSQGNSESGSHDERMLQEENDGEGDDEKWGYNCYDDAGYTNCNQCYKFETKTDMTRASREDLARASKQGTILRIRVYGNVYGAGGYGDQSEFLGSSAILGTTLFLLTFGVLGVAGVAFYYGRRHFMLRRALSASSKQKELKTPLDTKPQEGVLT